MEARPFDATATCRETEMRNAAEGRRSLREGFLTEGQSCDRQRNSEGSEPAHAAGLSEIVCIASEETVAGNREALCQRRLSPERELISAGALGM
jgi:hypothetical protein